MTREGELLDSSLVFKLSSNGNSLLVVTPGGAVFACSVGLLRVLLEGRLPLMRAMLVGGTTPGRFLTRESRERWGFVNDAGDPMSREAVERRKDSVVKVLEDF